MLEITLINQTTLIKPEDFHNALAAMQVQAKYHVLPFLGIDMMVNMAPQDNPGYIKAPLFVVDTYAAAPAGALGWHTVDNHNRPYGIVPVKTNIDAGYDPIPTISHELLEMMGDLYIGYGAYADWPAGSNKQAWMALELCDPVEDLTYPITLANGAVVNVSNFVFWPWFEPTSTPGARYDFMKALSAPLTITHGGYASYFQNGQWQQAQGQAIKSTRANPHELSRHGRRVRKHAAMK